MPATSVFGVKNIDIGVCRSNISANARQEKLAVTIHCASLLRVIGHDRFWFISCTPNVKHFG